MDIVVQMLNEVWTSENEHFTPVMDMGRIFGLVRKRGQCCERNLVNISQG